MREESISDREEVAKKFTISLTPEKWQEVCTETFAKTSMPREVGGIGLVSLLVDFSVNLYKQLSLAAAERGIKENGCAVDKD